MPGKRLACRKGARRFVSHPLRHPASCCPKQLAAGVSSCTPGVPFVVARQPSHEAIGEPACRVAEFGLNSVTGPREIASTKNDADPVAWRQWHHWNVLKDIGVGSLPKGKHVLTIHIINPGNVNLAYFGFKERNSAVPGGANEK